VLGNEVEEIDKNKYKTNTQEPQVYMVRPN